MSHAHLELGTKPLAFLDLLPQLGICRLSLGRRHVEEWRALEGPSLLGARWRWSNQCQWTTEHITIGIDWRSDSGAAIAQTALFMSDCVWQHGKTSCRFLAWLKDIHDDIVQRPARSRSVLSGRSCLACSRLGRLAEGETAALAAWELTDRQGRLDYITTPVPSSWHLTVARAGRVGHWLLISTQWTPQPMWEEQTAWSFNGRACTSSPYPPHKACELIRGSLAQHWQF